jgi:hypothetical protein
MKLADGIKRHGFRKWYERELLQSHAHLLLMVLCTVGLLGAFEAGAQFRSWQDQALDLLAGLLCAGTGLWAMRRYLGLLAGAEAAANQAECPHCHTYGRLECLNADRGDRAVAVRCRNCGQDWKISV